MTVMSVYAPQAALDDSVKELFYENLKWTLTKISASEILFVCGMSMFTLERMQMDMKFMVEEDLEDIIWKVRELSNLLSPTT